MSNAPCGKLAGYARHWARLEPVCDPCQTAFRDYQRARRAAIRRTRSQDALAALLEGHKVKVAARTERRQAAQILTRRGWSKPQIAGQLEMSISAVQRARAAMRAESSPERAPILQI